MSCLDRAKKSCLLSDYQSSCFLDIYTDGRARECEGGSSPRGAQTGGRRKRRPRGARQILAMQSRQRLGRRDRPINAQKQRAAIFSFLYLKKIKISKIYVRFGKFQNYTPVALWGGDRAQMYFFFFKFATKSLEKKKGPVAPPTGDRPMSPVGGGDRVLCFSLANKAY